MKTNLKVIFASLVVMMLLIGATGIALAYTEHVKQASLGDRQDACVEAGGSIIGWHFVINQLEEEDAPATIHVIWDNGVEADVAMDKFTGGVAHYTTTENVGALVVDATAELPEGWTGEFNLSTAYCEYQLEVTKTAETTYTRTYTWDIDKSVTPEEWDLFRGDSGTSKYTITVDRFVKEDGWKVFGTIEVYNPSPLTAKIINVTDVVSPDITAPVVCDGVTFPYDLAAKGTLSCTYSADLPNADSRTNTATAITADDLSSDGKLRHYVFGDSDTVPVTFGAPVIVGYPSVNVDDTNGGSWLFEDSGSVSYERTFACDGDEGTHGNTATIRQTGQHDDASVEVNCYALEVEKDANTSFDRKYDWNINKVGDDTELTLSTGQTHVVNYAVTVNVIKITDSNWAVDGTIWIHNPAPISAQINGISDVISPDIAVTVDCGVSFPYTLAAETTLECTYHKDLPNADFRINTATATLQNFDYDFEKVGTPGGTTDFSGSADVDFSKAVITLIDECITVKDDKYGDLGVVCYNEAPKTFNYSMTVGPYEVCGSYKYINTASFVTNDTEAEGSSSWTVLVDVPCPGCTLTPGYWKTHSEFGPARYDDTWALLPSGASTPFYLSGQTYYAVLWTPPQGNAYYILAHAYIAAKLNVLNGAATTPQVASALSWANSFFTTNTPATILTKSQRQAVISKASLLDSYNNGLIGPGHCDE